MANTSFSSGFATGYSVTSTWKANKEKKDMIKGQEEASKAFALDLAARFDRDKKSGLGIDQEEYENGMAFYMGASTEQLNIYKSLYKDSMNMTNEELSKNLESAKLMEEMYADVDLKDYDGMKEVMKTWKSPKAKAYMQATMNKWKQNESKMKSQATPYGSYSEAQNAPENKGLNVKYIASINAYVGIDKEETSTYYKTQQEAMANAMQIQGHTAKPVQEKGGWKIQYDKKATTPKPDTSTGFRSTSVDTQSKQEKNALAAETLEDKQKLEKDYLGAKDSEGRGYDPSSWKVSDERWKTTNTKERKESLDNTLSLMKQITDDKGGFRPSEMQTLPVEGKDEEHTKEEWYTALWNQYMQEYDRLKAIGFDMSEYELPIPPDELETLGFQMPFTKANQGDVKQIWKK